jgi:hypothetical protein
MSSSSLVPHRTGKRAFVCYPFNGWYPVKMVSKSRLILYSFGGSPCFFFIGVDTNPLGAIGKVFLIAVPKLELVPEKVYRLHHPPYRDASQSKTSLRSVQTRITPDIPRYRRLSRRAAPEREERSDSSASYRAIVGT